MIVAPSERLSVQFLYAKTQHVNHTTEVTDVISRVLTYLESVASLALLVQALQLVLPLELAPPLFNNKIHGARRNDLLSVCLFHK